MNITDFLNHFDKVKRHGKGYMACCPAHDDRSPSLSITEGDDGRILVHCFAGCTHSDVVAAIGLSPNDLFADSGLTLAERAAYARQKRQDELRGELATESLILEMARCQLAKGKPLNDADKERTQKALNRVRQIKQEVA